MNEYWQYIKWLGMSLYEKQIKLLGDIKVTCIFHEDVNNKCLNDNLVLILDCDSIKETVYKIYKYKKKIEEKFKILDISIFKGNDNINFSETYLVSFYCVDYDIYKNNKEKYDKIFQCNLKMLDVLIDKVNILYKQEEEKLVEINNIPIKSNNTNINNLYEVMLSNIVRCNQKVLKNLKINRNKQGVILSNYDSKIISNKILKNTNVEYIDQILKIKNNKTIKGYIKVKKQYKKSKKNTAINKLINTDFSAIVILNCEKTEVNEKYINALDKTKYQIILISKEENVENNNILHIDSLKSAIKFVEGLKVIYIGSNEIEKIENKNDIVVIYENEIKDIKCDEIIDKVLENKNGLYAFANLDNVNSVKVLTGTFLNFDGNNYYSGGAERYLIDLHNVCNQIGMKLRIYQKANFEFMRYYNDIEVLGISADKENYNYDVSQNMKIIKKFNKISRNKTKLNIYSAFTECNGEAVSPSIGISHGIAWDHKKNKYNEDILNKHRWIIDSAISCDKLVSVDTNTANWFQTIDYKLGNTTEVVPNYVNIDEFKSDELKKDKTKITIVYPRRLYEARGLYLLLDNVDKILEKYQNAQIHFVGKGFKKDTDKIQEKIDKWGDNKIKMYNCPPEKMYEVYQIADISIIPTLYSEGTSLSCLEAMSTGNAVIATRIGGLTDLVINNYNGKLIEPNAESLFKAIEELIGDPELMKKCKQNAREVAKVFNKSIWIDKWKNIIKEYSKELDNKPIVSYKVVNFYISNKNIEDIRIKKLIMKKLNENYLVYIINNKVNKKLSYGRLQYINENEELYRKPDEILVDKEYENKSNIKEIYEEI